MDSGIDKKIEGKRLLIFLFLSFGLTWIIFAAAIMKGMKWDGSDYAMEQFVGLGMLMPFGANLLTRMITKEGFPLTGKDSLMLGIRFNHKMWKYYLFALLIPWICIELGNVLTLLVCSKAYDKELLQTAGLDKGITYVYPLIAISSSAILSFAALGEEEGWRGYMMPKLIHLLGMKKALIAGGVIWGLWHAPLTFIGHNFGTGYPGFPYVGILLMCVMCTLMGILLTFVTVRTNSIWPAAIMHAVNNASPSILRFYINDEVLEGNLPNPILSFVFMWIPLAIIDGIILYRMKKNRDFTDSDPHSLPVKNDDK